MGRMQRAKGAQGERDLANEFNRRGYTARRAAPMQALQRGTAVAPDVVVDELPHLWLECKRGKRVRIVASFAQAKRDASIAIGGERTPLLCFREDGAEWMATLRLSDLMDLLLRAYPAARIDDSE